MIQDCRSTPTSNSLLSKGLTSLRRKLSSSSSYHKKASFYATNRVNVHSSNGNVKSRIKLVPHISTSGLFDTIDMILEPGVKYQIGRYSNMDYHAITFRSKVVSREHAIMWTRNGKVCKSFNNKMSISIDISYKIYLSDTMSSGGTYINGFRLSSRKKNSLPHQLKDGDLVEFGTDFYDDNHQFIRAARMYVEINRPNEECKASQRISNCSLFASTSLASSSDEGECLQYNNSPDLPTTTVEEAVSGDVFQCCLCYHAIVPGQALFSSPCPHFFHFKCANPFLGSYPKFPCVLCKKDYNLDDNEAEQI